MRFIGRAIVGLFLILATLGVAGYGAMRLTDSFREAEERGGRPPARERVFAIAVETVRLTDMRPTLTAYGEIESARMLELRAARGGEIVELSDSFRDGGAAQAGELLFRIDPAEALSELDRARIGLAEAKAELQESSGAVELAGKEHAAAGRQRELRAIALKRQRDLRERGVGAEPAVEAAALALSASDQVLIGREQAWENARNRVGRAEIGLRRAELALADAQRALAETRYRAPFAGLLDQTAAVLGRRVNAGEKLGVLLDPAALEVAFRVSNTELARLVAAAGALPTLSATVRLEITGAPITVEATVIRAEAAVDQGQTGRMLYAALAVGPRPVLRPGDFVTVEIEEPELTGVAVIPSAAVSEAGRVLVVGDDDRLSEIAASILRRMGDLTVVSGLEDGARIVAVRQPQLGPGIKVRVLQGAGSAGAGAPGAASISSPAGAVETVPLNDERRARLIAYVEDDGDMAPDDRERILARLAAPAPPRALVERLEARMGGG